MKQPRRVSGSLLVIGLILIVSLIFVITIKPNSQAIENTVNPGISPSHGVSILTSTFIVTPTSFWLTPSTPEVLASSAVPAFPTNASTLQPPQCTFPLEQTTTAESTPEEYTFSEPEIVLANAQNIYALVNWLPGNQQVLLTQDHIDNHKYLYQTIELFDPQTGKSRVYATRNGSSETSPVWLSGLNAVTYSNTNALKFNKTDDTSPRYEFSRQLKISTGDSVYTIENSQLAANNLSHISSIAVIQNNQIIYLNDTDNQIFYRDISTLETLDTLQTVPFDVNQWMYRDELSPLVSYNIASRPGTSQVFLYSGGDSGGYTYILNNTTGEICEISLESKGDDLGWAETARWSSNGRYLAMIRTWGVLPISFSDLAVLDTYTGSLHTLDVTPQEINGRHFTQDIAWAPDNKHLIAIGSVLPLSSSDLVENQYSGLYFIDFNSGEYSHILQSHQFLTGWPGTNLLWSTDGSKIVIKCPSKEDDKLCLIKVQTNNVP